MAFPNVKPAAREFTPGDWPVKRYSSQSGAEVRILYGSRRVNAKLKLGYQNIKDEVAEQFLTDYNDQFGTLLTFTLPLRVRAGWSGNEEALYAPVGTKWRYESEPRVSGVHPGLSNVQVTLIAVA